VYCVRLVPLRTWGAQVTIKGEQVERSGTLAPCAPQSVLPLGERRARRAVNGFRLCLLKIICAEGPPVALREAEA